MKTRFLLIALATVALTLPARGGSDTSSQPKGPTSEDHTAASRSMIPEFARIGRMVKDEGSYGAEKFRQTAATFTENGKKPFTLSESDPQGNGRTLPAIWTDTTTFKVEEEKFVAAVEELNTAAQTGKLKEIKAAYGETGATYRSYHDTFRGPE